MIVGSVLQINVSRGGLPKRPIPFGEITPLGIVGDGHDHPKFHGGPTKAVLLISSESIAELTALGYPLYPGALGENITTQGVDSKQWRMGQRWRIGQAVVELTTLRVPCKQLDVYGKGIQKAMYDAKAKAGDPSSPCWAVGGFYASIVRPGTIRPGDPLMLLDQAV